MDHATLMRQWETLGISNDFIFCKIMEDYELQMGDKTTIIVLNAEGVKDDVSKNLKAFLDYVAGRPSDDAYVQKLKAAVKCKCQVKIQSKDHRIFSQTSLENGPRQAGKRRGPSSSHMCRRAILGNKSSN